ncbi:helix-turn-helix domain-containing protein [Pseudomonas corrugata]|uniref:helix-turn-helix domain-containing protein n=1 Tax=Pseudomonas corrugata TaxID=47879 RepID=UPI0006D89702|nr:helix-turn-helix transcriptional regulator [Pseudomonas corrugata]
MTSPIRALIGSRIRSHRKARHITQAVLAEALDCEVTTIGRYERGDHSPDGEQLVKLANFFNVSPLDFLPAEIDIRWQTVCELRSVLIDLIYRIDDPVELRRLITAATPAKKTNLR